MSSPVPDLVLEQLLTPDEVAAAAGVCAETVARWARAGRLAAVRTPGGRYRFRADEVRAALHAAEAGRD